MRIAAILCLGLVLTSSCSQGSYERERYRRARADRSVEELVAYLEEDGEFRSESKALIDRHYQHAIDSLAAEMVFQKALLGHLRQVADPRILVHLAPPTLTAEAGGPLRAYFASRTIGASGFASGASRGASRAFDHEIVAFEADPNLFLEREHAAVHATWTVGPSDLLFEKPFQLGLMSTQQPLVGIQVEAQFSFIIPGHAKPFVFNVKGRPEDFRYTSHNAFVSESELYYGMAESAFEELMFQVLRSTE